MAEILTGLLLKVAEEAFPAILRRVNDDRWEKAQAIIRRRLARGEVAALLDDKAAYGVWLYFKAAAAGAAARNLELIAQAVVSEIRDRTLFEEDLKRVTDVLAGLSREEAIIIGTFIKGQRLYDAGEIDGDQLWPWVKDHLLQQGGVFKDRDDLGAHAYALVRTGWIIPVSAYGGLVLVPTALLDVAARMVDFDDPAVTQPRR